MPMYAIRSALPVLVLLALAGCNRMPASAETEAATPAPAPAAAMPTDADLLARGEYLVRIGTCNDCHTPGYNEAAGELPTAQWLVGSPIGFHGPWGTTYAANLRLKTADMDEAAWLKYTGELHTRPIMPDFMVRAMKEEDRLAIFRFIKSLGPDGQPAPDYLPPGQKPQPPYWELVLPPGPPPQAPVAG
ncbi:MAG TPA: cytochrome C [Luteimonas sp.]|nr:cytochrome C [Luteimonas sp.]